MRTSLRIATALAVASISLLGCQPNHDASPTGLETPAAANPSKSAGSPQEDAVLAALADYKQAVLDSDVGALDRIWADDYTFINPQGAIANKAPASREFLVGEHEHRHHRQRAGGHRSRLWRHGDRAKPLDAPRPLPRRSDRHGSSWHVLVLASRRPLAARHESADVGRSVPLSTDHEKS